MAIHAPLVIFDTRIRVSSLIDFTKGIGSPPPSQITRHTQQGALEPWISEVAYRDIDLLLLLVIACLSITFASLQ